MKIRGKTESKISKDILRKYISICVVYLEETDVL